MKTLKWVIYIILIPVTAFGLFLLFASITNYSPKDQTVLQQNETPEILSDTTSYSMVCWNIGYAGLDKSMDFFYDGGKKVRPTEEASLRNLEGILKTFNKYSNFDFVLVEEVDLKSKRSYHINQFETIGKHFPGYSKTIGLNYNVKFVPLPPTNPMGLVESGVTIYSKTTPAKSVRYSFPGNYSWPMSLFMLDRCFVVNEYPLANGKKLIVIVTHNSAYDDGSLRKQQMDYMKNILLDFYNGGNYVIAGGDWNQCPYGFEPQFGGDVFDTKDLIYIDKDYPAAGWTWAYDPTIPTNRRVMIPYEKGKTPTTLIDYFLLSPNVELEHVNGRMLGFEFSDHQPIEIQFKLKMKDEASHEQMLHTQVN